MVTTKRREGRGLVKRKKEKEEKKRKSEEEEKTKRELKKPQDEMRVGKYKDYSRPSESMAGQQKFSWLLVSPFPI